MKFFRILTFSGFFFLLLSGCATSSLTSLKSDKINGPYKRMFIMINGSARADAFIDGFLENVKKELAIRNTESASYISSRLSLDTKEEINKKISAFQPDAILIINQTESVTNNAGMGSARNSNGGTFVLKLYDKTPDNLIWTGQMTAYGEYGIAMAATKASDNLISKLVLDGIISK